MSGFSHEKTTHHFRLFVDRGPIEVTANDPKDPASGDQIRMHLSHIVPMLEAGDFEAPVLIHDRVPPGVPTPGRLKADVTWRYEDLNSGGRIRITTGNKEVLATVDEFFK
jgi:hypothetical protein